MSQLRSSVTAHSHISAPRLRKKHSQPLQLGETLFQNFKERVGDGIHGKMLRGSIPSTTKKGKENATSPWKASFRSSWSSAPILTPRPLLCKLDQHTSVTPALLLCGTIFICVLHGCCFWSVVGHSFVLFIHSMVAGPMDASFQRGVFMNMLTANFGPCLLVNTCAHSCGGGGSQQRCWAGGQVFSLRRFCPSFQSGCTSLHPALPSYPEESLLLHIFTD